MFGLICRFVPSTWWSVWLICLIIFRRYWFKDFVAELRQQLTPRITFDRSFLALFLSGQDLSPPLIQHVLLFFELLLLPFQAPSCGNELLLEAFLIERFFWDDEVFVTKANLLFEFWHEVAVLRVFVVSASRAALTFFPLVLFGCGLDKVFGIFGVVRGLIISGAGIVILCPTRS